MKVEVLQCPSCGAQITKDSKICSYCGGSLVIEMDGSQAPSMEMDRNQTAPGAYLTGVNPKKIIETIKAIRKYLLLDLRAAKALVDQGLAGKSVFLTDRMTREQTVLFIKEMEAAGTKVEILACNPVSCLSTIDRP